MTTRLRTAGRWDEGKTQLRRWRRARRSWWLRFAERAPVGAQRLLGPLGHWFDMLFVDHGIFRLLYLNRHRLGPDAWRSAQPAPYQIGVLARRGLRTIINLRGERPCGSYWLEQAACRQHGITLIDCSLQSRQLPTREQLEAVRDLLRRVEHPLLVHCKSGADRAGLMSVLYRHVVAGEPIEVARRQLSWRYGHLRWRRAGILDALFERYLADATREPMAFYDWVATRYDPAGLQREFRGREV